MLSVHSTHFSTILIKSQTGRWILNRAGNFWSDSQADEAPSLISILFISFAETVRHGGHTFHLESLRSGLFFAIGLGGHRAQRSAVHITDRSAAHFPSSGTTVLPYPTGGRKSSLAHSPVFSGCREFITLLGTRLSSLSFLKVLIYLSVLSLSWGMWDLVSDRGIEPRPSALAARNLSHWATRKVLPSRFLKLLLLLLPPECFGSFQMIKTLKDKFWSCL